MGKLFNELKDLIHSLLFVDNPTCPACKRVLFGNGLLCEQCGEKLNIPLKGKCLSCKEENIAPIGALCEKCRIKLPFLDSGTSLFIYDDISKLIIYDFKFNANKALASECGKRLWEKLCSEKLNIFDTVIYVPMIKQKESLRGYNQAEEIAKGIAETSGKKVKGLLYLKREIKDQITLDNIGRSENVKAAFGCIENDINEYGTLLLVDDVMTTGSTLNECAKTLLSAGAKKVIFAVVACA